MPKLLIFWLVYVLASCASIKYNNESVLEKITNSNGIVTYEKVKRKYHSRGGKSYDIIIFRNFDSIGRITQEYGFENWGQGDHIIPTTGTNNKYLVEYRYKRYHCYLITTFVWPTKEDSNFVIQPQFLVAQRYTPDSIHRTNNSFEISIFRWTDSILSGQFSRRILNPPREFEYSHLFNFEIKKSAMEFNENGTLKMDSMIKTYDFLKKR
jgi:hypothetical protein